MENLAQILLQSSIVLLLLMNTLSLILIRTGRMKSLAELERNERHHKTLEQNQLRLNKSLHLLEKMVKTEKDDLAKIRILFSQKIEPMLKDGNPVRQMSEKLERLEKQLGIQTDMTRSLSQENEKLEIRLQETELNLETARRRMK